MHLQILPSLGDILQTTDITKRRFRDIAILSYDPRKMNATAKMLPFHVSARLFVYNNVLNVAVRNPAEIRRKSKATPLPS